MRSLKGMQNTIQTLSWTIPRPHLWYPGVTQLHVKHNTIIELRQSLSLTYRTRRSLKCVQSTLQTLSRRLPLPHWWYPGFAQPRVKHNTNIKSRQSLSLTYGTLTQMRVKHNTNIELDNPSASLMVPWCCSTARKTQYKHWVEPILQPDLWYPEVAQMRVKHNTHIELDNPSASLMVPWCRSTACKTPCKHWVETILQPHLW